MVTRFIAPEDIYLSEAQALQNAQVVADIATGWGWSQNAIAALCGNMRTESRLNPNMYESGYNHSLDRGYGLVQWTPATKYTEWAAANSLPVFEGESQLARIKYEIENGIQWISRDAYPESFVEFSISTQPITYLVWAFARNYERPNEADLLSSMPERQAFAELCRTQLSWTGGTGQQTIKPLLPVTAGTPMTSPFGYRDIGIGTNDHLGTDWGGAAGDPIFATMHGTVVYSKADAPRGNYIIIKHTYDDKYSTYQHNSANLVSVGAVVQQGQKIAEMGTTGDSTGVHLHFAISNTPYGSYADDGNAGTFYDPEIYLQSTIVTGGGSGLDKSPSKTFTHNSTMAQESQTKGLKNMTMYTVKSGDSLSAIAKNYGVSADSIQRVYTTPITNKNLIMVGDVLAIPQAVQQPAVYYTVRSGDSLSAIAAKYAVSVSSLQTINGIKNPDRIQAGQTLKIK